MPTLYIYRTCAAPVILFEVHSLTFEQKPDDADETSSEQRPQGRVRWYNLWDKLFPGVARPESPYYDEHILVQLLTDLKRNFLDNLPWPETFSASSPNSLLAQNVFPPQVVLDELINWVRLRTAANGSDVFQGSGALAQNEGSEAYRPPRGPSPNLAGPSYQPGILGIPQRPPSNVTYPTIDSPRPYGEQPFLGDQHSQFGQDFLSGQPFQDSPLSSFTGPDFMRDSESHPSATFGNPGTPYPPHVTTDLAGNMASLEYLLAQPPSFWELDEDFYEG